MRPHPLLPALLFALAASLPADEDEREPPIPLPPETLAERKALPGIPLAQAPLPDPALAQGTHYRIAGDVRVDGPYCRFLVHTTHADYDVLGIRRLMKLCQEIDAIERYRATAQGSEAWKGAKESVKDLGRGLGQIVDDPGEAGKAIGRSFARLGRSIGRMAKKQLADEEEKKKHLAGDGTDRTRGGKGFLYAGELRRFACELGVDVYTDNLHLQSLMRSVAKERSAGRFAGKIGLNAVVPIPGSTWMRRTLTAGGLDDEAERLIAENDPDELRRINRKLWKEDFAVDAGASPELRALLDNPNYTPRESTYARVYLGRLRGVEGLETALASLGAADLPLAAETMIAQLELLSACHAGGRPVGRLIGLSGCLGAVLAGGPAVTILPFDYVVADEDAREFFSAFSAAAREAGAAPEVWLTGVATKDAFDGAAREGIALRQNILRRPWFKGNGEGSRTQPAE